MTNKERSVEEIVGKHTSNSHVEMTESEFREILQTERQKREEVVEAERERILNELPHLRQTTINGEVLLSEESVKGAVDNWRQYEKVYPTNNPK